MVAVVKQIQSDHWGIYRQDMPGPGMMHWVQIGPLIGDRRTAILTAQQMNRMEFDRQRQNAPEILPMIMHARLRVEGRLTEKRQGR